MTLGAVAAAAGEDMAGRGRSKNINLCILVDTNANTGRYCQ